MSDSKVVFLEGKKTILRPYAENTDLPLLTLWFNDPETRQYLGSFMLPLPELLEKEQMRTRSSEKSPNDVFLVIQDRASGQPIGTLGLHRINWINRTATTGSCIGEPAFRGRGFGTDAKMALLRYAFFSLNLRVISAAVIEFNERSAKALLKQGYCEVGRLPEWHFRDGKYWDERLFALTLKGFEQRWKVYQEATP
ncbi:MAG TPA: GNAT family protein [Candidatus Paceibacterota bacterium]|nr:GNAT family protein [Candidatus Paceibacterota bacterium]